MQMEVPANHKTKSLITVEVYCPRSAALQQTGQAKMPSVCKYYALLLVELLDKNCQNNCTSVQESQSLLKACLFLCHIMTAPSLTL